MCDPAFTHVPVFSLGGLPGGLTVPGGLAAALYGRGTAHGPHTRLQVLDAALRARAACEAGFARTAATQAEIGRMYGVHRTYVAHLLALYEAGTPLASIMHPAPRGGEHHVVVNGAV